jgi:hypothetical protein
MGGILEAPLFLRGPRLDTFLRTASAEQWRSVSVMNNLFGKYMRKISVVNATVVTACRVRNVTDHTGFRLGYVLRIIIQICLNINQKDIDSNGN